jgi:hypothetical protein
VRMMQRTVRGGRVMSRSGTVSNRWSTKGGRGHGAVTRRLHVYVMTPCYQPVTSMAESTTRKVPCILVRASPAALVSGSVVRKSHPIGVGYGRGPRTAHGRTCGSSEISDGGFSAACLLLECLRHARHGLGSQGFIAGVRVSCVIR